MKCAICDRKSNQRLRRQRCETCYKFLLKNNRDRNRDELAQMMGQPRLCKNCKKSLATRRSQHCLPCLQYIRRTRKPRPRHLYAEHCKVCKKPKRSDGNDKFSKGRCPVCANYWRKFKKERSTNLIRKYAPFGWCDCGAPAEHETTLNIGFAKKNGMNVHPVTYRLCPQCYAQEKHP